MAMNKSKLKNVVDILNDNLNVHCYHDIFFQWILAALDVIECKIINHHLQKTNADANLIYAN